MRLGIVTTLLLLAVLIGGWIVSLLSKTNEINRSRIIKLLLSFSGGFLLAIAFHHFLPELYEHHVPNIGIYVIAGFIVQMLLEFFSGGIEHGHFHTHKSSTLPYVMLLSLSIHSFIEGIPLAIGLNATTEATFADFATNSYLLGIIFHQIPVAIALMACLKAYDFSTLKSWVVLFVFGIMTPLGMFFGFFFGNNFNEVFLQTILAIVIGMFLHISTTIIFESTENHKFNIIKLLSILIGVALAVMINVH